MSEEMRTSSGADAMAGESPVRRKERRGFASMSPEKQREIASKGGREPGSVNEHEVARTFQCAVPGFSFALTMASASLPYSSSK